MKLIHLTNYTDNNSDEIIFNALTKSSDNDLIEYVVNVTSDLLNNVFLSEEFKINAKKTISKYDEEEIGQLATYMSITPYVQAALIKDSNFQDKATAFLECYIGYIIDTVDKEEFLNNLEVMRNLLNLSTKFYNGLISFFGENMHLINNKILEKLQF